MNKLNTLLLAAACALPLAAVAQGTTPSSMDKAPSPNVKPADAPRSDLEKKQTTETGNAPKYGQDTKTTDTTAMDKSTPRKSSSMTKSTQSKPGDVPTYPAPGKDGAPTSTGSTVK